MLNLTVNLVTTGLCGLRTLKRRAKLKNQTCCKFTTFRLLNICQFQAVQESFTGSHCVRGPEYLKFIHQHRFEQLKTYESKPACVYQVDRRKSGTIFPSIHNLDTSLVWVTSFMPCLLYTPQIKGKGGKGPSAGRGEESQPLQRTELQVHGFHFLS